MKKNIITTITLLMTMVMGMQAADLTIAGTTLTKGKAAALNSVSNSQILSGTVYYDGDKTVVLNNVVINCTGTINQYGLYSNIPDLKVMVAGANVIKTTSARPLYFTASATIGGQGTLTAEVPTINYINTYAVYVGRNSEETMTMLTIEDAVIMTVGGGKYGFYADGSNVFLAIGAYANVTVNKCETNALYGFQSLLMGVNAKLTLTGNGNYPTVSNLGQAPTLADDFRITSPTNASYNSSAKTIVQGTSTTGYTGDIVIKKVVLIDESNFPDKNFRSYLLKQTYYGQDGVLTDEEIAAVKEIKVSKKNITSLKGIEYFTALTTLYCISNQLTALDVSKNTALTYLTCDYNKLTTLDLSKNTALTTLSCQDNRIKGEGMDALVNSLPKVTGGKLYALNSSSGTELNVCTKAQVTIAKGKGWTVYNYTNSWQEYAGKEPIAINEENFPDANFRSFLTSQDYGKDGVITDEEIAALTTINVSSKNIASLKGIEFFTALTEMRCYNNQLIALDVSKNTALTELYCESNQLTALDVSKNTALTVLRCYSNQLTALDVSKNTKLTMLSCGSNLLTALDVSKNTALTELYCQANQLTVLDVSKNTVLTVLYCWSNQLTALDLSKNTALTELRCNRNQLTALDVSKNTKLTMLACYENQIKGAQMDALVNSLPTVSGGEFYVYAGSSDLNVCTKAQVATAKKKGWTAYNTSGDVYEGFIDVLKGDANGDGKVDIVDVTSTISYILGQNPATFNKEAADVNGDKKVDIVDVTTIIDIILGK